MFELFVLKHKTLHINEGGDRNISELKHLSHYIHFLETKYRRMHKDEMQDYTVEQNYLQNTNAIIQEILGVWPSQPEQSSRTEK